MVFSRKGQSISEIRNLWYIDCKCLSISAFQCSDACSAVSAGLVHSVVRKPELTTMSADAVCRPELDPEHHGELADLVAAMNVAANCVTPPNGFRSGPPRTTNSHRARLSDRKMSLQERGSRIARQPTIETKRVSITDADVRSPELQRWYSEL